MPSGCIDAGWMQDGVIAQMGVVAEMQGGCRDARCLQGCRAVAGMQLLQLQGWGDCRGGAAAGMQNSCRDGVTAGMQGGCIDARWQQGCRMG